jgi:hypothetical protein
LLVILKKPSKCSLLFCSDTTYRSDNNGQVVSWCVGNCCQRLMPVNIY